MEARLADYLFIGVIAAAISFAATPLVRLLSMKIGAIDNPNDRKVHARPTPTLGGLAIFIGIGGSAFAASLLHVFRPLFTQSSQLLGIGAGALVIFLLGAVDDLHDLPAPVKLAGQVFAAGILFLAGVKMQTILLPGNLITLGDDVSVLVTVLWLVAMMNAVNLVDGLDGLAAGIVAIAGSAFFVYTFQLAQSGGVGPVYAAPLIAILIVGAALGFLRHNFHPARIFMGDSGSMLLGLVLGAATVIGVGSVPSGLSATSVFLAYFPLLIPLMVLALPILDAMFAIVRRARRRRSVFHADKEHIHDVHVGSARGGCRPGLHLPRPGGRHLRIAHRGRCFGAVHAVSRPDEDHPGAPPGLIAPEREPSGGPAVWLLSL
ncbi:MAG: undecaprenyl/decaprenyl-phosphate alpha-N-acetylglucosaminyl 1-phosphate transferase [Actinomycetota bacterium]|nr:undecaprenyl/decaprenyl-phosphate alpha-N-acetylglucosaminyl 1-phosphate transferase [Actinomycetota bacterium]